MNVERLHAIALELRRELQAGQTPSQLAAVISALEQMVSQPLSPVRDVEQGRDLFAESALLWTRVVME